MLGFGAQHSAIAPQAPWTHRRKVRVVAATFLPALRRDPLILRFISSCVRKSFAGLFRRLSTDI